MVLVVHNHFGHAILSLPMVESNQNGPFWKGVIESIMNGFPLPNEGQNIGDHVAPFLSLALQIPQTHAMDFDAIPWTQMEFVLT
jgi:hypothetical protein